MSAFTPQQQDELTRLIQMQVARSDLATLVRQLQGGAVKNTGGVARIDTSSGVVSISLSASQTGNVTVNHGLGVTPTTALTGVFGDGSNTVGVSNLTSTTLRLNGYHIAGAVTGTVFAWWLVLVEGN